MKAFAGPAATHPTAVLGGGGSLAYASFAPHPPRRLRSGVGAPLRVTRERYPLRSPSVPLLTKALATRSEAGGCQGIQRAACSDFFAATVSPASSNRDERKNLPSAAAPRWGAASGAASEAPGRAHLLATQVVNR